MNDKREKKILITDSGAGGLSVLRALRETLPEADVIYVADYESFPYGDWEAGALETHLVDRYSQLIEVHRPAVFVIACNTASTLVLPALRERFDVPFVGTVPAIKPAAAFSKSGLISVLATPGTVKRDYTRGLVAEFAQKHSVQLVGSASLAKLVENWLVEGESDHLRDLIFKEIEPCFVRNDEGQTDCVVLACTHYPLLTDLFRSIAPWPVHWFDPSKAIARRIVSLAEGDVGNGSGSTRLMSTATDQTPFLKQLWCSLLDSA